MSRRCELTGKMAQRSASRSHSNIRTLRKQYGNLQKKKILVPELNRSLDLMLSSNAIRTMSKHGGLAMAIIRAKEENLSPRLQKVKRELLKK